MRAKNKQEEPALAKAPASCHIKTVLESAEFL
jgi:hypothetical protein